eukprot:evm.model.scf_3229.1 EVM.evm.TU.scf_3229.1   scf_3229:8962-12843(+)
MPPRRGRRDGPREHKPGADRLVARRSKTTKCAPPEQKVGREPALPVVGADYKSILLQRVNREPFPDWGHLPVDVLYGVKEALDGAAETTHEMRACRLVNRHWARWATEAATRFSPSVDFALIALTKLTGLTHVSFVDCGIADADLEAVGKLARLERLELHGCKRITDRGLGVLVPGARGLKALSLRDCWQVSDAGLSHVARIASLTTLDLHGCGRVTDVGLAHLTGLKDLRELKLGHCREVTDQGLAAVRRMTSLRRLDLVGCFRITSAGLEGAAKVGRLKVLGVCRCERGGLPAAHIHRLSELRATAGDAFVGKVDTRLSTW